MRILIASGIYPPDVGGPAQYARNLFEIWKKEGHEVKVAAYRWERAFPSFVRHFLYFLKVLRKGWNADLILVLDTWSAAVPTMAACALLGKKYIIRTGGDFLWESYVERTGEMVFFRNFYTMEGGRLSPAFFEKLSRKEKIIFALGKRVLLHAAAIIFSTEWQKGIFEKAYNLEAGKNFIVENFCGERLPLLSETGMQLERTFVAWTRPLKWKNIDLLKEAFQDARGELKAGGREDIELYTQKIMYDNSLDKMHRSWAVILVSIGDISPNMIYDALMTGTPFIVTREIGITERIKDAAIFVDPLNKKEISEKIIWISDPQNREMQAKKVRSITFVHSWKEIAGEIVSVWKKI